MPCPHFSREDSDCRLVAIVEEAEEARGRVVCEEPVNLSLCLAQDRGYRACAIYRRQVAELSFWPVGMQFGGK